MAVAEAAVSGPARRARAGELQLVVSKLASAREAIARHDYERAGQLADEAKIDAQLAELHAQTTRSRKAAKESEDAARVLNEELDRKTTR